MLTLIRRNSGEPNSGGQPVGSIVKLRDTQIGRDQIRRDKRLPGVDGEGETRSENEEILRRSVSWGASVISSTLYRSLRAG